MIDEMSESEALQDSLGYDVDDLDLDCNRELTKFEKMLQYHEIDNSDWVCLSNNQKRNFWWNYNKFGSNETHRTKTRD